MSDRHTNLHDENRFENKSFSAKELIPACKNSMIDIAREKLCKMDLSLSGAYEILPGKAIL